ncbi:helix-turn-helix domain-containing protein [Clostridium beijerinckii]|nr:helix-turn-helix transcriptional regulator [Clostridium beijerinckii]MZK53326.1 helix-turn-helix domain-containing protein [Clostridium beijerinckii]MZK61431.1 helix-turn-helix domain-containing protein [Clostridium beijerinckii]MZK71673.1 helix-turn-helix domain-containing protein [Clostridium beijerinckii]MZK77066.1 helix-turn-helix domain-containing protein [Clostridium beijerinckii]MZK86721.1 helix-turn-helix domain-containing protein [Clostridium beijerinckii]
MIKELREKKGLTQSELAKKLKLSKSHVSRMEKKLKAIVQAMKPLNF